MKENWTETTLGEVAEVLSGSTPLTKEPAYWNGDIAWITPKDLSTYNSVFISRGERNITEAGLKNSSAQLLPRNTILFSSRAPIGYVAIASNELTTNQGFKNIVCDEKTSHYKFFYYSLKFSSNSIEKLCSGSTFSEANATVMRSLQLLLPPLAEQKAIAAILSSFDDKIELLRRQNKTLEQIGQTVFKEWFVKFKVKGEKLKTNSKTDLPEGWRMGKLGEILAVFDSKRIPLSGEERAKRKGKYPYYGATEIMDYIDDYIFDGIYVLLGEDGSVIDDQGYAVLQYVWGKIWVNNHAHVLQGKNGWSTETLYLLLKRIPVSGIITGAVQLKINQGNLLNVEIVLPDNAILKSFDSAIQPIFTKIRNNYSQIQTLSKLRDLVLPKLMKGEIRVKDLN